MIILDADILALDLLYTRDARFARNRACLERLRTDNLPCGIMVQALLEVVGKLSFNTTPADIPNLWVDIPNQYQLTIVPDPDTHPAYAACGITEVLAQMSTQMALGDAVLAVQVRRFAPAAIVFLSWNARHFRGKFPVPVLTPDEWLNQQPPAGPTA